MLEVLELGLEIVLACVVTDELDGFLIVLGWELLRTVLNEVFEAEPGLIVFRIKDLLVDLLLNGEPRGKLCALRTVWCVEGFLLGIVVADVKGSDEGVQAGQGLVSSTLVKRLLLGVLPRSECFRV